MRTAIMLGSLIISDSIVQASGVLFNMSDLSLKIIASVIIVFMIMDIFEFLKKINEKKETIYEFNVCGN
jgi:hypothetical protein